MFKRLAFVLAALAGLIFGVAYAPEPWHTRGLWVLVVGAFVVVPLGHAAVWIALAIIGHGAARYTIGRGVSDGMLDAAERYRRIRG